MVKYLTWYINHRNLCKGGSYKINIKFEVEKFKRKYPERDPVVIFDFMSSIAMLVDSEQEVLSAGRHTECTRRAREMCEKFKKLGVKMIFYLHGPIKKYRLPIWVARTNEKYKYQLQICEAIKNNKKFEYELSGQIISTYFDNFLRIANEYGKICIAIENECDREITVYANRVKALAVIASESDFLIMPGNWSIWSPKDFDLDEFSTIAWNKKSLRESLKLQQEQMPVLAAICGNDFIPYDMLKDILEKIKNEGTGITQELFAAFVKKNFPNNTIPLSNYDFDKLVNIINVNGKNKYDLDEIKKCVKRSMDFYNISNYEEYIVEPNWLYEHIEDTKSTIVYIYLKDKPFTLNQSFIDLKKNDVRPFADLVIPIIQRQMGIVLYDQRNNENITRKIYYKTCHEEPFDVHDVTPIYPDKDIPKLMNLLGYGLINDVITDEKRFEILAWALSTGRRKLQSSALIDISHSLFLIPSLILNYLVKNHQITIDEADVVLLTLYEAAKAPYDKMRTIKPPKSYQERPFWIAFVYTQLAYYFLNTFIVCGLHKFIKNGAFDGYVFHKMYPKYLSMNYEEKQNYLLTVQKFRLYTK